MAHTIDVKERGGPRIRMGSAGIFALALIAGPHSPTEAIEEPLWEVLARPSSIIKPVEIPTALDRPERH